MDKVELPTYREVRLEFGEAWMYCCECNCKLYSFDGNEDRTRGCPYKKHGKCEPKGEDW